MASLSDALISIVTASVSVAIVATLVSKNAQTPQVINAAASGYGNILGVALSPVNGGYTPTFANNGLSLN